MIKIMMYDLIIKWQLKDLCLLYQNNIRNIYSAYSEIYGPCILKIGNEENNLLNEYNFLSNFKCDVVCKVFAYDFNEYALLLETIVPGTLLKDVKSLEERINIYFTLCHNIHKITNSNFIDTYLDLFIKVQKYIFQYSNDELLLHVDKAITICHEMFEKYSKHVLLHGDLHHYNILLSDDRYVVVDPKGVIGPSILEVGRFILNEMSFVDNDDISEHIMNVISQISYKFNYDLEDVVKVFYMEVVLANAWNYEDGMDVDFNQIKFAENMYLIEKKS